MSSMFEIIVLGIGIAVLFSNRSLAGRVSELEAKMRGQGGVVPQQPARATPAPSTPPSDPLYANDPDYAAHSLSPHRTSVIDSFEPGETQPRPVYTPPTREPDVFDRLGAWLKEDPLMKVGAFIFILGCGWFVSYAFANNWVGPVGRITIGIVAGALVMLFGYWRMRRFVSQGAVFLALGAGMIILSIFAGRSVYQFFTPVSAIFFDFIIVAFVSFASYQCNVRALALIAQILAFASPLLVAGQTPSVFLFSYLFVISLATLVLAGVLGWRSLIASSLVFVSMYSAPYILTSPFGYGSYAADAPLILNFAYLFGLLYFLSGMSAVVRRGVVSVGEELFIALFNGLFLFVWIKSVQSADWQVLTFAAWAIAFAVGSFFAYRLSDRPHPFYAYGSVAVAFLAAATAAQLSGAALTIAFTVEAALIVLATATLTKNLQATSTTLLLFVAPVILSLQNIQMYLLSRDLFSKDFFVLVLLAVALIVAGRVVGTLAVAERDRKGIQMWSTFVVVGTLYIWVLIWGFMHALFIETPDIATLAALVIYLVTGLAAYFLGRGMHDGPRRVYGAALIVFVIARLLLVEVWAMELSGRVITFFAIGILLMSTAFFFKRKVVSAEPVA